MASAAQETPVVLELGKDAAVVCRDADLDHAARGIVWGAFLNCGQTCASVERVYVEEPVAEAFIAKVVEETRKLRVGDPKQGEVDVGPLTMERQRRIVEEHVDDALARGAKALTGGARPEGPGYFYPPTVLTGVDHSMRVMREEDLRARAPHHGRAFPRRGHPPRQRQRVRSHRQRLDQRPADGALGSSAVCRRES